MMYAHQNPFRTGCIEALCFDAIDITTDQLLRKLDANHGRGSLVGPKGSGKTTLLLELAEALEQRGITTQMIRLTTDDPSVPLRHYRTLPPETALLLDGAEQLPPAGWWFVRYTTRTCPYVITTSHTKPHLPLLHRHTTSPELLGVLIERLTGHAPRHTELTQLYSRHNGNLRECLRECYDECAPQTDKDGAAIS